MGNMKKNRMIIIALLALILLPSCDARSAAEQKGTLCVATWNVQNLFDAEPDGNEYDEYTPSSGWGQRAYENRLAAARRVLDNLPLSGDYILVLNEIEGPYVVEDLINSHDLIKLGLRYFACTEETWSPIQIAVASSMPISDARVHAVGENLRPILEVEFETGFGKIFVLACHFKSNVGGVTETESQRILAARTAAQISRTLEAENPGALVLICGDLNEECTVGEALSGEGPLPCGSTFSRGQWYDFWMDGDSVPWPGGSYWYDGAWRSYDNILISLAGNDLWGWDYSDSGVVFTQFQKAADGKPFAWDRRLLKGISDHLPVWVRFSVK